MENVKFDEIKNLIVSTFERMQDGVHSWKQYDEDMYLVIEPESDGEIDYLSVYITDKIDSLGYGNGNILFQVGLIDSLEDVDGYVDEIVTWLTEQGEEFEIDEIEDNTEVKQPNLAGQKFDTLYESVMKKIGAK